MATTWPKWQAQLLSSASLPVTARNRAFLLDWHQHASSSCRNNPVDISHKHTGSTDCKRLPGTTLHAQAYRVTSDTQIAFQQQIHAAPYRRLLAALKTGNPYSVTNIGQVRDNLEAWGSPAFAALYFAESSASASSGKLKAASLHKGYADIRRSINRTMPDALYGSHRNMAAGLRNVARARKVRIR